MLGRLTASPTTATGSDDAWSMGSGSTSREIDSIIMTSEAIRVLGT